MTPQQLPFSRNAITSQFPELNSEKLDSVGVERLVEIDKGLHQIGSDNNEIDNKSSLFLMRMRNRISSALEMRAKKSA